MTRSGIAAPIVCIAALPFVGCSQGADTRADSSLSEVRKAAPVALQQPLSPTAIPKFVNQLPLLQTSGTDAYAGGLHTVLADGSPLTISMCEFQSKILPTGTPLTGNATGATWVWGYSVGGCPGEGSAPRDTYLGPVLASARGTPTPIRFVNDLGTTATTHVLAWKLSSDQTIHWADPLAPTLLEDPTGRKRNMCEHERAMGQLPVDMGDMGGPDCRDNYSGPIPAVPHLHGGEVPSTVDGGPEAWFTSDGRHGSAYHTDDVSAPSNSAVFTYPNAQEPGPGWFHDHTLGATRLNVYAGLAGAYLIVDPSVADAAIPPATEIVPVVIQDRMFDTGGQLLFQAGVSGGTLWALNPDHPYWSPEFVGDTIVVNGKAWPNLDVEPRRYRFLFLNGSNARTYELFLVNRSGNSAGANLWVIATDGGFVEMPVPVSKLVMMPGERYEVLIDFGQQHAGTQLVLKNTGKTPYPAGEAPDGRTLGQIMQFTVVPCASGRCGANDTSFDPSAAGARVRRTPLVKLVDFAAGTTASGVTPSLVRQLTLNEIMGMPAAPSYTTDLYADELLRAESPLTVSYPGGPIEILLNNSKWEADTTETPIEGTTEIWEIVNLTADSHPIHLHLVQFQVLNRQAFDAKAYTAAYGAAFAGGVFLPKAGPPLAYDPGATQTVPGAGSGPLPVVGGNPDVTPYLKGFPEPAAPYEAGWKDTAQAPPGTVTRFVVRWAPTSKAVDAADLRYSFDPSAGPGYVWHCHIIDHEDNEMMRRTSVRRAAAP